MEARPVPHILIEYSANLGAELDRTNLLTAMRDAALETGVFPLGGIRVRAYQADRCVVADGDPDNAYIHVMLRVGHGRDLEIRKRACDAIFAVLCEKLEHAYDRMPLGISLEMQEVDAVLTCKKNNLHEYVRDRNRAEQGRSTT
jgi:5-carboxymethyl-2-hydroxymuconate isomerase